MTRRFASPVEARRQLASDDVALSTPTPEPSTEPLVSEGLPGLVTRLLTLSSPPQSELTAHRLSLSPVSIQHPPVSPDILHSPHSISCNDPLFEARASLSNLHSFVTRFVTLPTISTTFLYRKTLSNYC